MLIDLSPIARTAPGSHTAPWMRRILYCALVVAATLAAAGLSVPLNAIAQVNVTTQHNDIGRTGQNLSETILTPANVNSNQFGLVFSQPVAGGIYAQPLYLSGITINSAFHNVVFVATRSNYVYAFDANSNSGANADPLWGVSLIDTAHGAAPGATDYNTLGIASTPVIDPSGGGTMYIVSTSMEGGAPIFRLHALDVTTGMEKFGGPVAITPTVMGAAEDGVGDVVPLVTPNHNQRGSLLLLNGVVYVSFGSYPEGEESVWHGWVVGYDASSLAQTGVFCTTPNGRGGGIWMSGNGLAADQLDPVHYPYGRMFVATGNGDLTAAPPYDNNMNYGDSVVTLDLTNGMPTVTDDFTPYTQAQQDRGDLDQGSGGVIVLPTQTTGAPPNLLIQAGKTGTLFLLNRDALGGYNTTTNQVVQSLPLALGNAGTLAKGGVWSSPAYWNGNVYYWGVYDNLKSFPLINGLLSSTPTTSVERTTFPSSTPSISANGNTQGIVWTINIAAAGSPAILEAHDASNVASTLYSSATNSARDTAGVAVNFAVPTIANGMVYVGTANQLDVYGLVTASQTATPIISPGTKTFAGSLKVKITDTSPNAAIFYTTDGTAPTSGSAPYVGAITVSSSQMINAVALAPGLTMSNQAWAIYSRATPTPPVFSLAADAYSSPQSVAITDATPGATIYYTTDGSIPTVNSAAYSSPILVSATETINAVAMAPGYSASVVKSAAYTIANSATILINDPAGFASAAGYYFIGGATLTGGGLQLSLAGPSTGASAAWFTTPVNVQSFTTDFYFQEANIAADGFTFTLQNAPPGLNALGNVGGGLGYQGIGSSIAVKFDLFDNAGEGINSTGFYTDGAAPTFPAVDLTSSGLNLHGSNMLHAHITYDGATLTLTLIDVVSAATYKTSTPISIPGIVGANTAYAGFTSGTHGSGATQTILNWTYVASPTVPPTTATPTYAPGPGVYPGAQSVVISDAMAGTTIYYTVDGSVPNTSSAVYTSPITVSANETLSAIAQASGFATSAVATSFYQFSMPAPIFSPAAGTYTGTQSVTLQDAISGAVIYYTTKGTTPTMSSPVYSGPIAVGANETLKAIAVANGNARSAVSVAAYLIRLPSPQYVPAAGTYSKAQLVTIGDVVGTVMIYYTTDGTTPTTSSPVYSGPIAVGANETLKAIAVANGYVNSSVTKAFYKIK